MSEVVKSGKSLQILPSSEQSKHAFALYAAALAQARDLWGRPRAALDTKRGFAKIGDGKFVIVINGNRSAAPVCWRDTLPALGLPEDVTSLWLSESLEPPSIEEQCIALLRRWQSEGLVEKWQGPYSVHGPKYKEVEVTFFIPEAAWEHQDEMLDQLLDLETDDVIVSPMAYPVRASKARAG